MPAGEKCAGDDGPAEPIHDHDLDAIRFKNSNNRVAQGCPAGFWDGARKPARQAFRAVTVGSRAGLNWPSDSRARLDPSRATPAAPGSVRSSGRCSSSNDRSAQTLPAGRPAAWSGFRQSGGLVEFMAWSSASKWFLVGWPGLKAPAGSQDGRIPPASAGDPDHQGRVASDLRLRKSVEIAADLADVDEEFPSYPGGYAGCLSVWNQFRVRKGGAGGPSVPRSVL